MLSNLGHEKFFQPVMLFCIPMVWRLVEVELLAPTLCCIFCRRAREIGECWGGP